MLPPWDVFPTMSFLAKRTRGSCSRSDFFGNEDSTTIKLTDDLEDQGASRSAVLSPTINLQGASWNQEGAFYGQEAKAREADFGFSSFLCSQETGFNIQNNLGCV
jgi:hypothetical protein